MAARQRVFISCLRESPKEHQRQKLKRIRERLGSRSRKDGSRVEVGASGGITVAKGSVVSTIVRIDFRHQSKTLFLSSGSQLGEKEACACECYGVIQQFNGELAIR